MQTERSSLDLNIRTLPIAEKVTTQHCLDLPRDSQVSERKQIISAKSTGINPARSLPLFLSLDSQY